VGMVATPGLRALGLAATLDPKALNHASIIGFYSRFLET